MRTYAKNLTEEDAPEWRRGDAESRLCATFDANGFKPPTRVVEKKKDIPCWNPLALDMGCKSVPVSPCPRVFFNSVSRQLLQLSRLEQRTGFSMVSFFVTYA
ncbi:hypothetical protein DSM107003_06340 [Trichormus variabilis SAG 1403-4b]|uniref:Uncharacterized protein n=1 Tax=Trichormus variabilis SAG 1403-4b TaxID=447716 RepID=A0A3S1CB62_ANAVA|nr:hypothetical protein DSM107003_06340 [Trichormus variabilis SAG 1403-4b]